MIRVREAIVVEGKYDKNTLRQIFDAVVIEVRGFGIFSNDELLKLLRRLADRQGLLILTDSDGAGLVIRNYLRGTIPKDKVKHAYIPEIQGRETRKRTPSRAGTLGVEGMRPDILIEALRRSGATLDGEADVPRAALTKADLYEFGLSGVRDSAEKRARLMERLDLPLTLSANAMLEAVNMLYDRKELLEIVKQIGSR